MLDPLLFRRIIQLKANSLMAASDDRPMLRMGPLLFQLKANSLMAARLAMIRISHLNCDRFSRRNSQ